jgi:pimeloyl-ACP methyl ester carboxylesterase
MFRAALLLATMLLVSAALAQDDPAAAPGAFVSVGDHALHLYCAGEGSPTVILEAGLGDGSINFRSLQSRVARFTRVCAYDRAGYGWSESGAEPRDMNTLVGELETLLAEAGETGPYVLAGHSFGGVIALAFTARNPEAVSGVVLIDSSHPGQMKALEAVPEVVAVQDMEIASLSELVGAAEAGALPAEAVIAGAPPVLSPALQQTWAELFVSAKQLKAMTAEYASIEDAFAQASRADDIGSTPLIVLSRGIGLEGQLPAEALDALGLTPEVLQRFNDVWSGLQVDLASLSTDSKRIVAERSTHYVYYGQPELVEAAIRELVREARAATVHAL